MCEFALMWVIWKFVLLRANYYAGWKLVFGHHLPLQHDKRGKLATICRAGEHDGELVLLLISDVNRHIACKLI